MRKIHLCFTLLILALIFLGGAGCTAGLKAEYHLKRAARFFTAGQYDRAELEYINVLRNDHTNSTAISQLGVIYYDEGRFQRAASFIFQGSQVLTNNLDLKWRLGMIYLGIGQVQQARDAANAILDRQPDNANATLLLSETIRTRQDLGEVQKRLKQIQPHGNPAALAVAFGTLDLFTGDIKGAESSFQNAIRLDPGLAAAHSAMAAFYQAQNNLKLAGDEYKRAADLSPARSPLHMQYAQFLIKNGDVTAGKAMMEAMTKQVPDYVPAWLGLAELALNQNDFEASGAALKEVQAREPNDYAMQLLGGRLDLARGDADGATRKMERMVKSYPLSPQVFYQLAMAQLIGNDFNGGINSLKQALNLQPNYPDAIVLMAGAQVKSGNPQAAISPLKALIKRQPAMIQARLLLAEAYRVAGDFNNALATDQQLAADFPQDPQAPLMTGYLWLQQNNPAEARRQFARALALAPGNLNALQQLVNLDVSSKDFPAALKMLGQALQQSTNAAPLHLLRAQVALAQQNNPQAVADLNEAIRLQPRSATAYLLLAKMDYDAGQYPQAVAQLNAALDKIPDDPSILMLLATAYNQENNFKSAADTYEKLLLIDPAFSPALNNLAYIYSEQLNQLDRAYDLAKKARALLPDDPATADTLGWVLYREGQFAAAASLLQESADKLPNEPTVQFHLGMVNYMLEKNDAARAAFRAALQANPKFAQYAECKEFLSLLTLPPKASDSKTQALLEKHISTHPGDSIALARLASIYQLNGASDLAASTYESALKAGPKNPQVMINLAQLIAAKDLPKALDLAQNAYNLAPDAPGVAYVFGKLTYQNGNYKWAYTLLQSAAQSQSATSTVLFDFAKSAYSVGSLPEAKTAMSGALQMGLTTIQSKEAQQFIDLVTAANNPAQAQNSAATASAALNENPNYVPALMLMAALDQRKGNSSVASQIYEKVLNLYPDFSPAQKDLAMLYASTGNNLDKAYTLANKARAAYPNDPDLDKTMAIIVFKQGDYPRASNLFSQLVSGNGADAETFYYLGMAQYNLKKTAQSKVNLQQALRLNPTAQFAPEANRVLSELK